jgi:ribosome-associated toxin RatA of RatAB toxin-antitoxin module
MTKVEHRILVNVPVSVAYNQWTQFEDFPHFMNGIKKVTQLSDDRLEWVAQIAGVRRQWEAKILEQIPDKKVAWAATEGATNAGQVVFEDLGGGQTSVQLTLEYEPEGLIEKVGDKLNVVDNQTENDLERFKALIEAEGYASGAWRGTVEDLPGTPQIDDADASRGDSGKAGVSGKVVAAGVAAAAAAAVGVAAATKKDSPDVEVVDADIEVADAEVVPPIEAAPELRHTTPVAGTQETTPGPLVTDGLAADPAFDGDGVERPKPGLV